MINGIGWNWWIDISHLLTELTREFHPTYTHDYFMLKITLHELYDLPIFCRRSIVSWTDGLAWSEPTFSLV
jgi:hypothetical protein